MISFMPKMVVAYFLSLLIATNSITDVLENAENQCEEITNRLLIAMNDFCSSTCHHKSVSLCGKKACVNKGPNTISGCKKSKDSYGHSQVPDLDNAHTMTKYTTYLLKWMIKVLEHSSNSYPIATDAVVAYGLFTIMLKTIYRPIKVMVSRTIYKRRIISSVQI